MFCAFIFIIGTLLSILYGGGWYSAQDIAVLQQSTNFTTIQIGGAGPQPLFFLGPNFFTAVATILTWNYPYLDNTFGFILKMFLWSLSFGVVWGFAQVFIPVLQGVFSTIINAIRGLV